MVDPELDPSEVLVAEAGFEPTWLEYEPSEGPLLNSATNSFFSVFFPYYPMNRIINC